ncbi:MAG: tail fiber protein [Nitrospiraceae bacterium]|nr:tail fiber protein [Nitrospiraceae bacterium]
MLQKKNFSKSTLGAAITNTAMSLTVAAGDGVKFPQSGNFMAVLWGAAYSGPDQDPNAEIVLAAYSSADAFTITRAREGTTAGAWNSGDHIAHVVTAGTFSDFDFAGEITMYAGVTAPSGWLICDGSAVSRTTYAGLYNTIGTTFGAGDGSTTFNLPDLRGRVPVGVGQGTGLTGRALAAKGGEEAHVLVKGELPSQANLFAFDNSGGSTGWTTGTDNLTTIGGSDTAHNNMQPYLAVNFIIRY